MYSAIKAITNSLMIIDDDFVLQQVNYDDDESAFNDNDQTDDESTIPYDCTNIKKRVSIALYNAINYYWQVPSEEGMLAALLDPRYKTLSFTSESLRSRTYNSLHEVYRQHQNQIDVLSIKQPLRPTSKLLATMFRSNNTHMDEISDYIGMPKISYDQCPFEWWKSNQNHFLVLAYLARKYLAILATSTSSKRLFSEARNIMSTKRANLLPITLEHLIFLNKNRYAIGDIFSKQNRIKVNK